MPLRSSPLPRDIDELIRMVLPLEAENAELRVHSALLKQMIFGPKSEKLATIDPTQSVLELGDLSAVPVAANDDAAPEGEGEARRGEARRGEARRRNGSAARRRATSGRCRNTCRVARK